MPYRHPDVLTLVIAALAAGIGAIARWYEKKLFKSPFHWGLFAIDMALSAAIGVLVFWIIVDLGQPESFAAMGAAIAGNIGSRFFDICQNLIDHKINHEH